MGRAVAPAARAGGQELWAGEAAYALARRPAAAVRLAASSLSEAVCLCISALVSVDFQAACHDTPFSQALPVFFQACAQGSIFNLQ